MMNAVTQNTVLVPPSHATVLEAFGDQLTVHLRGEDTGGKYALFTSVSQPGGGPPPHYHLNEDELFMVIEGQAEFFSKGAWHAAPVGTAVFTPRGVVHTFRNAGTTPLKLLVQTSPAGFEHFFAKCAAEFKKPGPPDMNTLVGIAAEHGIHFVAP